MCQPYSMHVLHPLEWYMMERFSFHVHAWLSGSLSSTSIRECSWCPPLLGKPLGSSSSLGWPIWSSSSPGFRGFLFIMLWYCFVFSAGGGGGGCWSVLVYFFPLRSITIMVTSSALIFMFWLPLSSWHHCHSFWQIPPSLDIAQCQVIIEGLVTSHIRNSEELHRKRNIRPPQIFQPIYHCFIFYIISFYLLI